MAKTKYTYLYNGQVVRNSNRLYRYGLLSGNHIIACSGTTKALESEKSRALKLNESELNYYTKKNDAEYIEACKADVERVKAWQIVELEVREN